MKKLLDKDHKVVFFKLNTDGTHSITYDYKVIGESKNQSLIVIKNYNGKEYPNMRKEYIKNDFICTKSAYWQPSTNKPKYLVRILPVEF
jgi:hypothetical protein